MPNGVATARGAHRAPHRHAALGDRPSWSDSNKRYCARPYWLGGLCPNHPRSRAPKPPWFLAALSLAFRRSSAADRAASASASLRSAPAFASCAAFASVFACWASLVARAASSFARFKSTSASASLCRTAASEALAFCSSDLAFWASVFTHWSSFRVESASVFADSLAEGDREADEPAGAGCTVDADGKVGAWPALPFEEEAVAADLNARTSRAISRQVRSSVLLDSPPVLAKLTQCCLSAAEKVDHSFFNSSRTCCSL